MKRTSSAARWITNALVLSQVVLSLVLPIPMIALVKFTARRDVMGEFANSRLTNLLAVAAAGFVCLLNGVLMLAIVAQTIPTTLIPLTVSMADRTPGSLTTGIIQDQRRSG